ncbi:hypothetical protein JCM3774_003935 [Rhodotorula dairenensis]
MPKLAHSAPRDANHAKPYARQPDHAHRSTPSHAPDRGRDRGRATDRGRQVPKAKAESKPAKPQPQHLDLSGQLLSEPPSLADYAALSKLNLTNCGLDAVGFVKHAAHSLTWLNVSGNDLGGPRAWDGVETLSTLFVLNASHCKLEETPRCVGALKSLKALVLSHNSLTKLEHVAHLPDLNTIVVSNNALTALPRSLATLPALKKISAAHNQLSPPGLPDLSALSHLHELRLNDNRPLSSLPAHFGSWGRAPPPPSSTPVHDAGYQTKPRRAAGLEILDLGNCGFESWFGLRELAKQDGIVNLGLKGNKVAEQAIEANGFDSFREKLTILLPSLRILDTHRFDAKHAELKAARSSRTAEQKILDAGPMALALNEQSAAPVQVDALLKERERERENKRRRKKGIQEQVGEGKSKRRRDEEPAQAQASDGRDDILSAAATGVDKGKKRAREAGDRPTEAVAAAGEEEEENKPKKPKKRTKAERKALAKARTGDDPQSTTSVDAPTASSRTGGALAALRGEAIPATATSKTVSTAPVAAGAAAAEEDDELRPDQVKQKTSVAKIIDVRKAGGGKKKKQGGGKKEAAASEVDVGALLGLAPPGGEDDGEPVGSEAVAASTPRPAAVTTADPLAALGGVGTGSGSGLFGSGGWD